MPKKELTTEILSAALEGFEAQKKRLEEQIAELKAMLAGVPKIQAAGASARKGKRTLSAAARAAISAAQKRRWAKAKQASGAAGQPAAAPAKKRRLSAAGRLAIAEAARRRWAKAKAAQQAPKPAAPRKAAPKKAAAKKTAKVVRKKAAKAAAPAAEATSV